jgi:hypothetical protein
VALTDSCCTSRQMTLHACKYPASDLVTTSCDMPIPRLPTLTHLAYCPTKNSLVCGTLSTSSRVISPQTWACIFRPASDVMGFSVNLSQ